LKNRISGGSETKVVALGIGSGIDQSELEEIATSPPSRNVLLVQDFSSLSSVEERFRTESCTGIIYVVETWTTNVIIMLNVWTLHERNAHTGRIS